MFEPDSTFALPHAKGTAITSGARKNTPAEIRDAAEQFEALFVQQILKKMRSASPDDSLFGGSGMEMAHEMFDTEVAKRMSQAGGLGLADMLVRQLGDEKAPALDTRIDRSQVLPAGPAAAPPAVDLINAEAAAAMRQDAAPGAEPPAAAESAGAAAGPAFDDPRAFVEALLPLAREAAAELHVPAEAIVAQSALETGWGRHMLTTADGQPAWNLFGIKADDRWTGERVSAVTLEVRDGIAQREVASFRAYSSPAEAVEDYVQFLSQQPRYAEVSGQNNSESFAAALQSAGYATDPDYADKIERVARQLPVEAGGSASDEKPGVIQEKPGAADA